MLYGVAKQQQAEALRVPDINVNVARMLSSSPQVSNKVAMALSAPVPIPQSRPDIFEQARIQYPIISDFDFNHAYNGNVSDGRMLESWPVGEEGNADYPRPSSLPLDKFGLEIFDKNTTARDVAADIISHQLVYDDPMLSPLYRQFESTFYTPEGLSRLQDDYEWSKINEGENRPLDVWAQNSRIPAYFRGYAFKQWPESEFGSLFSPEQIDILDKMKQFIYSK